MFRFSRCCQFFQSGCSHRTLAPAVQDSDHAPRCNSWHFPWLLLTSETSSPLCPSSPRLPIHFHFCSPAQNVKENQAFFGPNHKLCGFPWALVAIQQSQYPQSPVMAARSGGPSELPSSHALRCRVAAPFVMPLSLHWNPFRRLLSHPSWHVPPKKAPPNLSVGFCAPPPLGFHGTRHHLTTCHIILNPPSVPPLWDTGQNHGDRMWLRPYHSRPESTNSLASVRARDYHARCMVTGKDQSGFSKE